MKTMHLFSGAGGGLLADLILGHEPIFALDHDKRRCEILRKNSLRGWYPNLHVHEGDIRLWNPSQWQGRVDCINAGFPCQDISAAGTGKGIKGEKSVLVIEVFRAIDAVRPALIFLENSPFIRTRGRKFIITEFISRGYSWRDGILAASDVGALHRRSRWWLLAANADGFRKLQQKRTVSEIWRRVDHEIATNSHCTGFQNGPWGGPQKRKFEEAAINCSSRQIIRSKEWFEVEPNLDRLVYGFPHGIFRGSVSALGDSQIPLQAAAAFMLLSNGEFNAI